MRKIRCYRDHRMIQIVPDLWLCECSAYGRLVDMKGAVAEARRMAEAAGGVASMRRLIEAQEDETRRERMRDSDARHERERKAIREGV